MSNEPYIGTDPIYQNHANDVDAPLASEDPKVAALEERAMKYQEEMVVPAPAGSAEAAAEDDAVELPDGDPDESWTKPQIQAHLDAAGTHWTTSMTKDELLELV